MAGQGKTQADEAAGFAAVLLAWASGPQLRKAERTRLRLLAAIARQLGDGMDRARLTVAGVTAEADLAHGTFYRYFTDIQAATEALVEAFAGFVGEALAAARDGEPGSRRRVRDATLVYARLFRRNFALMRCLVSPEPASPAFARAFRDLNRLWTARMAASIARRRSTFPGEVTAEAMLPVAIALGGMVDEFLVQLHLRGEPALAGLAHDDEAVADLLADLWLRSAYGRLEPRTD